MQRDNSSDSANHEVCAMKFGPDCIFVYSTRLGGWIRMPLAQKPVEPKKCFIGSSRPWPLSLILPSVFETFVRQDQEQAQGDLNALLKPTVKDPGLRAMEDPFLTGDRRLQAAVRAVPFPLYLRTNAFDAEALRAELM